MAGDRAFRDTPLPMIRLGFLLLILLLPTLAPGNAVASVEVARAGHTPVTIPEVYLRGDVPFLALDDVLPALGLGGYWDSVRHVYSIRTPEGRATLFPGGHYLNVGDRYLPLSQPARFIDGRLRAPEDFFTKTLADLLDIRVYYRNLSPPSAVARKDESTLDRLFAFLLHNKNTAAGPALRGLAIDPGHGGQDPGSIADGVKEKDVNLAVARDLEKELKMQLGIPVYLSRNADYAVSLQQRMNAAAHPDIDALVQLHAQAEFSPAPHGVMLFVRPNEESQGQVVPADEGASMRLALALQTALEQAEIPVDGIFPAALLPLGRGDLPTVLVEMGFLSNPGDRGRLTDPAGRQALAGALYQGLRAFGEQTTEDAR